MISEQPRDLAPSATARPTIVSGPRAVAGDSSPQSGALLPVATVLLLTMAAANLWIMNVVPGLDQIAQTLPRVGLMLLTIAYLALNWRGGSPLNRSRLLRTQRWRTILALGLIGLNVVLPTTLLIRDRLARGPYPANVIDWPLQIEAGTTLLLQGRSPYGVDYSATEMRLWSERANFPTNPAIRHAIHLPVNFLLNAAVMPLWRSVAGWYDARILLIAAYLVVLLLAPKLARRWEDGHALLIGLALNPLLVETFVVGLSDYLLLAWLLGVLVARQRGWNRTAAALLGLAVATRQFSWLLVPVYLAAEWFALAEPRLHARMQALALRLWPLAVVVAGTILPFLLANPRGFYTDVIAFGSGGIADAYPIGGPNTYGFSVIVLALGWAKSQTDQFPFSLLQLATTVPVIACAVWMQRRENTLRRMLLSYLMILAVFLFTGRFMHTNYVGFLLALVLLGCFADATPLAPVSPNRPRSGTS